MALFEDFKIWLQSNIPKSAKHYITGYNTINKLIEEFKLTPFNNLDIHNIDTFIQNISSIDSFKQMNTKGSNMYSATLTNYKKFLMDQNLSIPFIIKPFEEFGWRWATTGIASYLNESKYLKTVLDAILINGNGSLNQTSDFKNLVETIGINKYKIEISNIDQISKKSNPSDIKNIIENSANYWYHLGLLETTGQYAKVSELGYNFLVGKLSNLEFVDHIINNYLIPSPIYKKYEIAQFEQFDIKFKPLKIIIDILLELEKVDKEQAFLTENDLKNLIVPFSITYTEENIEIFSSHLINFRNNPSLYNSLPDCTLQYTDDKGLRMLNEFLYFLECFGVLESNSTNVRSSEKKYLLNNTYKDNIQGNSIKQVLPLNSIVDFDIKSFMDSLGNSYLKFNENLIKRFVGSLITKPFVILTGLAGSGKTKLAQSFIQWICDSEKQYKLVAVGADWINREPLLGYPNGLKDTEYVMPDNGVLQLMIDAAKEENKEKPFFLVLDEMNLSHVERYFADFLSIMESND